MAIYIFIGVVSLIIGIVIGIIIGKRDTNNSYNRTKTYNIGFSKLTVKGNVIKTSYIVREITAFCDSMGIQVISFDYVDWKDKGVLRVKCNSTQHYLLIQELSKNEYMLEIEKIEF